MLQEFERLLKVFPFSRLSKGPSLLKVYAVEYAEPSLYEQMFPLAPEPEAVIAASRQFLNPDCAFELETAWDLWQYTSDWALAPSRAVLHCFGPEFLNATGEHLRVNCGIDTIYLPDPQLPGSARIVETNLRSLLKLSHDLDQVLRPAKRMLWTESGENFADRLKHLLE